MRLMACRLLLMTVVVALQEFAVRADEPDHPIPAEAREQMRLALRKDVDRLTESIKQQPDNVDLYSSRGDALFFLGDFKAAVADYEKMVELEPDRDASHWRRGIAQFYAGDFEAAAQQFEKYHSFDDVDRENGIWRYFSQYRAYGEQKAREGLLKYRKTDREPFPSVYKLFSKELTSNAVLQKVAQADLSDAEREPLSFYAELYVGLNEALEGRDAEAIKHLRLSTASKWGPQAGYGPRYMWHVGRVHYELLLNKSQKSKADQ